MDTKNKTIQVRIDKELYYKLIELCTTNNLKLSRLVREMIVACLENCTTK